MRITVLAVDDVFDTGLASILDTFEIANVFGGEPRFDVTVASPRARVRTHHGFSVPVVEPPARTDLVIVPALACKEPDTILAALGRSDVAALVECVRTYARRARISAACRNGGTTYSAFIAAMGKAGITLDRKVLSEMAILDPAGFTALLKQVGLAAAA